MDASEARAEIEKHRDVIDSLDIQIVKLLNERAAQSLAIRALKPAANMELYDPAREDEIVARLQQSSDGPMHDEDIREIYSTLLKVMKSIKA